MSFRFSLAAVLKYREALEQLELAALERVQQEIAQVEAQIQQAEQDQRTLERRRTERLKQGMPSIHLQNAIEEELAIERFREELSNKLSELALKRQEVLKTYEESRQKRELLARLRDRKFLEYMRAQAKAEQAMIDDLFLSRRRQT